MFKLTSRRLYFLKRLLLVIPTILAVLTLNFFLTQLVPGGPLDSIVARIKQIDFDGEVTSSQDLNGSPRDIMSSPYVAMLAQQYGLDQPMSVQYATLIKNYLCFDFGNSIFHGKPVWDLVKDKLPVSLSLGFWAFLCIYLTAIPLGILMASRGNVVHMISTLLMSLGYALPTFLLAILLIIFFAGVSFLDIFPLRGLHSDDVHDLTLLAQIKDYFWHLCLPVITLTLTGMSGLVFMSANCFLEELHKKYIYLARSKGVRPRGIIYKHVFPNAIIPIVAHMPGHFVKLFLTSNIVVEIVFSLDGLGLLAFDAVLNRDYPVLFALIYIYTLVSIILHMVGDFLYTLLDPRIQFEGGGS